MRRGGFVVSMLMWCVSQAAADAHDDQACRVVRYGAKLALPVQKWSQNDLSAPKTSHFRSPVCSSHVLTPHNASLNDPEAGWGCISSGAGTVSEIMASERPLRPKYLPFPPPACSPYELMPHNASLNDPEAGLGLHQLGGRAQQWLARKLKSRTQYLIPGS